MQSTVHAKPIFHPILDAALKLWRPGRGPQFSEEDVYVLRRVLVDGVLTPENLGALKRCLSRYQSLLAERGIALSSLPDYTGPRRSLTPHASAFQARMPEGMYRGATLGHLALSDRSYLEHLARQWGADPRFCRGALQALLGLPVTAWPEESWLSEAEADVPPNVEGAMGEPEDSPLPSGVVAGVVGGGSGVRISVEGEFLIVDFPYDPEMVKYCQGIHRARYDSDRKLWVLPVEAAVQLEAEVRFCEGNEEVLRPLADSLRSTVLSKEALRNHLERQGFGSARQIVEAGCTKFVIRSRKKPGRVAVSYPFDERINDYLTQRVQARWDKKLQIRLFSENDLILVYDTLKKMGFVFETDLVRLVDRERQRAHDMLEMAQRNQNPLRGARSADLEYVAANGLTPRPYQKADIAYALQCLKEHGGVGLFLDMGLGKTLSTTVVFDLLRREDPRTRALVFCPRSAFSAWKREMSGMLPAAFYYSSLKRGPYGRDAMAEALAVPPESRGPIGVVIAGSKEARKQALALQPDICVINYDSARVTADDLEAWIAAGDGPVLFINDESHRVKDPSTKTAHVVMRLTALPQLQKESGGGRVALSGSPISQGPWEFFTQAAFIDGGWENSRFGRSWIAFCEKYFWIDRGRDNKWFKLGDFKSAALRKEFEDLLAYYTVRRTKEQELDLPPKNYEIIEAEFEAGIEEKLYRFLLDLKSKEMDEMSDSEAEEVNPALVFLRMRQLLSHPNNLINSYREAQISQREAKRIIGAAEAAGQKPPEVPIKNEDLLAIPEGLMEELEAFVAKGGKPVKLELLEDLVADILADPREKVVIGVDFQETEAAVLAALASYQPIHYAAALDDMERSKVEERFQTDPTCRVMVANSSVIREGITLTAAAHMILYDAAVGYSTTTWLQLQDRVYRFGQTRPVFIKHLLVSKTIEVFGLSRVIGQAKEASRLLQDAASSLPDDVARLLRQGGKMGKSSKREMLTLMDSLDGSR